MAAPGHQTERPTLPFVRNHRVLLPAKRAVVTLFSEAGMEWDSCEWISSLLFPVGKACAARHSCSVQGGQPAPEMARVAARLCWWKSPAEALSDPIRFVAQVMTLGSWDDVQTTRAHLGEELFRRALTQAPPGVFDEASWVYWHHVFDITPVPPFPSRFPLSAGPPSAERANQS